MSIVLRTRFSNGILSEFMPPGRFDSRKVMLVLSGLHSTPAKRELITFFSHRGYWVFAPRYRGTWESDGVFLKRSPTEDVFDVLKALEQSFRDAWAGRRYKLTPESVTIIGSSFGGAVALDALRDSRISKAVLFSPVTDWSVFSAANHDRQRKFLEEGYGPCYRFSKRDWDKLARAEYCNPVLHDKEIDGRKVLMFHARDDKDVSFKSTADFAKRVGARFVSLRRGGHLSMMNALKPSFYKVIFGFLKKRL